MFADWTHRATYIVERHQITPAQANEALADPAQVVLQPDPASQSGRSIRVIGWSESAESLVTVIVVPDEGILWGANAWRSNALDARRYNAEEEDHHE
jgi:hypothetical protein